MLKYCQSLPLNHYSVLSVITGYAPKICKSIPTLHVIFDKHSNFCIRQSNLYQEELFFFPCFSYSECDPLFISLLRFAEGVCMLRLVFCTTLPPLPVITVFPVDMWASGYQKNLSAQTLGCEAMRTAKTYVTASGEWSGRPGSLVLATTLPRI